jgi:thiol-disulfide isomerase/thioredoxin
MASTMVRYGICIAFAITKLNSGLSQTVKNTKWVDQNKIFKEAESLNVGDKCPDFVLNRIINFPRKTARLSDFKGKWVILDFWFIRCAPCLKMLPVTDSLQKKFDGKIQFMPVTHEKEGDVRKLFASMNDGKGVNYPSVVEEVGVLRTKLFPHQTSPHYVWIDPQGVVRAITGMEAINTGNIEAALNNQDLGLDVKVDAANKYVVDYNKSFLFNLLSAGGDQNMVYHSVITKGRYVGDGGTFIGTYTPNWFNCRNATIVLLYQSAFVYLADSSSQKNLATTFPLRNLVLDIQDTVKYTNIWHLGTRDWEQKHLYNYTLMLPETDYGYKIEPGLQGLKNAFADTGYLKKREKACKIMVEDLYRTFNLRGSIERRKLKSYVLRCFDSTKLNSNSLTHILNSDEVYSISMENGSMGELIDLFQNVYSTMPVINETGLQKKFDIEIKTSLKSLEKVNKALEKYGLKFFEEERDARVLLLTDKNDYLY